MEGMINNEKIITKIKSYLSESALYLWYFHKNLTMASKHIVAELEKTEGWLQTPQKRHRKKGREETGGGGRGGDKQDGRGD